MTKVGDAEKKLLADEICLIDRQIRGMENRIADLREKRRAFELIRTAIW